MRGVKISAVGLILGLAGALAGGLAGTLPASAETLIGVGDTIDISVVGMPELQKRALVNEDGQIAYPMLGPVRAAGLSPTQLRKQLIEQLSSGGLVKDAKIGVEIVERQPFYVTGDVMKPGAQPYVLNVTVRSAVALAGGLDKTGLHGLAFASSPFDMRGQYASLAIDLVKQQAHLRRLEAELAGRPTIEFDHFAGRTAPADVVGKINDLEAQEFSLRQAETKGEKAYLEKAVGQLEAQLAALEGRRKAVEEGIRQQSESIGRLKGLAERGVISQERLLEANRLLVTMNTQFYDSAAAIEQVKRLQDEMRRRLATVDSTRRIAVTKELQDTFAAAALTAARLDTTAQPQAPTSREMAQNEYIIYRLKNGARLRISADENDPIQPGDIVEIALGARTTVVAQ